jgi:UDP-glucuronate 4-epimerase
MNILVTGGAGFIGSHTVKALIKRGHNVVIVDNFNKYYDPKLKKDRIKTFLSGLKFKIYKVDIANLKKLKEIFEENNFDVIVHQAAQAGVRYSLDNPFVYEESNVLGTLNILECAKDFNVKKIVFASSSSVYGEQEKSPFSENDKTDSPISLYAATKKATENICYSYHSLYKIKMVGLRYFTVYGPWGRPDMALFSFTKNILEERPINIFGEGKMKRDFTYIDDIIEGVTSAVEKDFDFEIFNLGYGNPSSLMDFVTILEEVLNKKAEKHLLPIQKGDVKMTYADISKAKEKLSFNPKTPLKEGVYNFVKWYKNYYHYN